MATLRRLMNCAVLAALMACSSSSSSPSTSPSTSPTTPAVNVSGTWSGPVHFTTTSGVIPSGSTSISFALSQAEGSDVVTFTTQPVEANGVKWTCPNGTLNGDTISFATACTLKSGSSCVSQISPSVTVTEATATTPLALAVPSYSLVWGGSGCIGNGIKVTVDKIELTKQ
jgi:hypothetical protein